MKTQYALVYWDISPDIPVTEEPCPSAVSWVLEKTSMCGRKGDRLWGQVSQDLNH